MASAEEETVPSPDEHLFELKTLFVARNIKLSARSEVGRRQLLAFVVSSGDLSLHYLSGEPGQLPVMRHIPWFLDTEKRISAMCFDPSGTWLLIAGYDNSLFIVPSLALVDSSAVLDHRWCTTDITTFPSTVPCNGSSKSAHPVSVVWWQSLLECQHSAIVGNDRGDIVFVSLTTGSQIGITYIKSPVATLHICQDNSLDTVFLLITDDSRNQWKLLLEQRGTGYTWPVENGGANKGPSSSLDLSSSQSSIDLDFGSRNAPHYPTARSRLQGLKQLSVEKLASLRQRLAETRSKGVASIGNSNIRRESSSSSSDETASISNKRKSSTASDTSHITSGPSPERLSVHVGETYLHPQYTRGRYLLSGYYSPSSILTIHGMNLEVVPLFVHKLPPGCRDVLVTDRFLFVTVKDGKELCVVSNQLSESRLDGDTEYNPESVIETFAFRENEEILAIYKCTESNYQKKDGDKTSDTSLPEKESSEDKKYQKISHYAQPKEFKPAKIESPPIDSCVVLTSWGAYEVSVRCPVTEIFLELVLQHQELEKAERLAHMFGLNLQELLEHAGDLKLAAKEFPQAIALYKLSRCRHLKSVLKFAAGGHSAELLSYINLLFSTSGLDLTPSEKIHLSNLGVMSHTEQVLRNTTGKVALFKQFLQFLRENLYYDEVLAVNVAGQTGLWEVLHFLASYRGLHQEVLDILTKIMRSHGDPKTVESAAGKQAMISLDSGLWLCVTDPSLQQSLLAKPQQARVHLHFVDIHLPYLEQFALQRLAALYDPSTPAFHFSLRRIFAVLRSRQSSESGSCYSGHLDSIDLLDGNVNEEFLFPMEHLIQTFLLVLLNVVKKQMPGYVYYPELMKKIVIQKEREIEDPGDLSPSVPLQVNHLCCGFSHVGLVRNSSVFTWGGAVQGCLGTGPTMSRYGAPQPISLFSSLMLEVSSVSCGRQHTLALTNNGVYAWGSSQFGQLGIGKTVQSPYPRLVEGLSQERIVALSCGQYHSTALAHDGRVFTWGWGVHGQLGHGSVEDVLHPTLVKHLVGKVVTQISGGHGHTLVLTADGEVYTFGSSVFGQLGNGTNIKSSIPILVTALPEPMTLIATGYFHNLAVSCSNKLYTWGSSPQVLRLQAQAQKKAGRKNRYGAQWDGDEGQAHLHPQLVDTGLVTGTISQISCGCHHSALLTNEGLLYIWGRNLDGQVGNGSRKEVPVPTPLSSTPTVSMKSVWLQSPSGISGVIPSAGFERLRLQQVCCGCEFTAALEASGGKVWAWGNNAHAQLGIAPVEDSKPLEGKLVMLKTSKRVIKLPHGMHNSCDVPKEVSSVPASTISFQTSRSDGQGGSRFTNERWLDGYKDSLCPPLCSIEKPCYGPRTLHYTLQHFHGHYDSKLLMTKCLELENYQAASKLAGLERHYHLALAYQLKAIALATIGAPEEGKNINTPAESNVRNTNSQDEPSGNKNNKQVAGENRQGKASSNKLGRNLNLGTSGKSSNRDPEIHSKIKNQKNKSELVSTSNTDIVNKENLKHTKEPGSQNKKGDVKDSKSKLNVPSNSLDVKKASKSENDVPKAALNGKSAGDNVEDLEDASSTKGQSRSVSVSSTPDSLASFNNPDENEMHTFAIQGGREQMSEDNRCLTSPESSSPLVGEDRGLQNPGNSSKTEPLVNKTKADLEKGKIEDTSPLHKDDSSPSLSSDEQCTVYDNDANNVIEDINRRRLAESNRQSLGNKANVQRTASTDIEGKNKSSVSTNKDGSSARDNKLSENAHSDKRTKGVPSESEIIITEKARDSSLSMEPARYKELVVQASVVVEYYVSVMEEDSHTMMSQLLQQGFEFWLSHSLPVDHLENLLLKHMPKFFYPLGLLLFCKGGVGERETQQESCMLNHLSTRFCLQLCSMLLGHIDQRKAYPDYIELLAQITALNVGPAHGVNGCYQGPTQTPEQLMEAILQELGGSRNMSDMIEQSFLNLNQEGISKCSETHSNCPDQLFVFSCGHRYGSKTFQQTVLPEMESGLLQLHRPLPNTARLLKGMFNASTPSIHLACPRCLLSHLQAQAS